MTTVSFNQGSITGVDDDGVRLFGGIPYAEPAVGARRFRRPTPRSLSGDIDARHVGPSLPQLACFGAIGAVYTSTVPSSQGALTLNVRTPDTRDTGLPVLVWLHGGGFALGAGSDPTYQHGAFARDGVIEVTVNYRLGVEGFGCFDDPVHGTVANLGLHDQITALRWVQDHIHLFGGDPSRVTLAGHSAGAISVALVMGSPLARGLFSKTIVQSAAAPMAIDTASASGVASYLAEVLGVRAQNTDALAALPPDVVLAAQQRLSNESFDRVNLERFGLAGRTGMAFVPVIDGEIITGDPMAALASGAATGIDVLGGWTRDEVMLHLDHAMGYATPDDATGAFMLDAIAGGFGPFATEIIDTYRSIRPDLSDFRLAGAINSDAAFGQATLAVVELASLHSNAYMYRFDEPTVLEGRDLGAIHGSELGYVFANPDDPMSQRLSGTVNPGLAHAVHNAWRTFMADGRPTAAGLPDWVRYEQSTRSTMLLASTGSNLISDPAGRERALWTRVFTAPAAG